MRNEENHVKALCSWRCYIMAVIPLLHMFFLSSELEIPFDFFSPVMLMLIYWLNIGANMMRLLGRYISLVLPTSGLAIRFLGTLKKRHAVSSLCWRSEFTNLCCYFHVFVFHLKQKAGGERNGKKCIDTCTHKVTILYKVLRKNAIIMQYKSKKVHDWKAFLGNEAKSRRSKPEVPPEKCMYV